jgi:hypothetical protein
MGLVQRSWAFDINLSDKTFHSPQIGLIGTAKALRL